MTPSPDEPKVGPKTFTPTLVHLGAAFALGGLLTFFVPVIIHFLEILLEDSGDTPVVIIGGSLTFKAGAKDRPWDTGGPPYTITPTYKVSEIAIKTKPNKDSGDDNQDPEDKDRAKDLLSIDVSKAKNSWEVDSFTADDDVNPAVVIKPTSGSTILTLTTRGSLCPDKTHKTRINYGSDGTCSDSGKLRFTRIRVMVDGDEAGVIGCYDKNGNDSKCRIVLRETK